MRRVEHSESLAAVRRAEDALREARHALRTGAPTMPECWALLGVLASVVGALPPLLDELALAADRDARRTAAVGSHRAAMRRASDGCHRLLVELEGACSSLADRGA